MKKTILLSLAVATVLFTGCDEKAKESVSEVASSVTSSVKDVASNAVEKAGDIKDAAVEKASEAVEATKEAASNAVEKAGDIKDAAVEKASEATEAVKEKVSDAVDGATASVGSEVGKAAYAKCAGCHGADGKTQALGKSAVVAGQSAADLEAALLEYKAGTRNVSGMGTLMKGQVASMSDDEIKAVAEYMSGL
jgi:cytochrome c553